MLKHIFVETNFSVEYYEKIDGTKPVKDFILSQNVKMRAKIIGILTVLSEQGNALREPYSAPLGDGLFEVRSKVGTDIARVIYFFYYDKKIILTNGFIKKTSKTPRKEIELAKKRRSDYIERSAHNE